MPYIEYKSQIQSYQWIGAGRDSDSHLLNLCSHWLDRKDDVYHSNLLGENSRNQEEVVEECLEEVEEPKGEVPNDFVPPPRCPTNWTVRLSTEEERRIFQVRCFLTRVVIIYFRFCKFMISKNFRFKNWRDLRIHIKPLPIECTAMKVLLDQLKEFISPKHPVQF